MISQDSSMGLALLYFAWLARCQGGNDDKHLPSQEHNTGSSAKGELGVEVLADGSTRPERITVIKGSSAQEVLGGTVPTESSHPSGIFVVKGPAAPRVEGSELSEIKIRIIKDKESAPLLGDRRGRPLEAVDVDSVDVEKLLDGVLYFRPVERRSNTAESVFATLTSSEYRFLVVSVAVIALILGYGLIKKFFAWGVPRSHFYGMKARNFIKKVAAFIARYTSTVVLIAAAGSDVSGGLSSGPHLDLSPLLPVLVGGITASAVVLARTAPLLDILITGEVNTLATIPYRDFLGFDEYGLPYLNFADWQAGMTGEAAALGAAVAAFLSIAGMAGSVWPRSNIAGPWVLRLTEVDFSNAGAADVVNIFVTVSAVGLMAGVGCAAAHGAITLPRLLNNRDPALFELNPRGQPFLIGERLRNLCDDALADAQSIAFTAAGVTLLIIVTAGLINWYLQHRSSGVNTNAPAPKNPNAGGGADAVLKKPAGTDISSSITEPGHTMRFENKDGSTLVVRLYDEQVAGAEMQHVAKSGSHCAEEVAPHLSSSANEASTLFTASMSKCGVTYEWGSEILA